MKKISICLWAILSIILPLTVSAQTAYKTSARVAEKLDIYQALIEQLPDSYNTYDTAMVYLEEKINAAALVALKNVETEIDFIVVVDKCHTYSGRMWKNGSHSSKLNAVIDKLKRQDTEYLKLILENKYYLKSMVFINDQIFKIAQEYNEEDEYLETVVYLKKKLSSYTALEQYWIIKCFSDWFDRIKTTKEDMVLVKSKMKTTGFQPIVDTADYY